MAKRSDMARRDPEGRRQAILEAALGVFVAQGFAAAKLDEVAEQAGVAKGTIYLHFKDKQDLFEQVVRSAIAPVIERLEALAKMPDLPVDMVLNGLYELFRTEVLGTSRKDVLRLVIAEGPRFPAIAAFYHREVVSRGLQLMGGVLRRAGEKGELATDDLAAYPQLVVAPLILAVVWDGLLGAIEPIDVKELLDVYRRLLLRDPREPGWEPGREPRQGERT
jgi:AcrR family transcriptional regulator